MPVWFVSRTGPTNAGGRTSGRDRDRHLQVGTQAYGFDDIAIVPSRRTRDPEDVDISWEIDAYRFDLPLLGAAMDGVMSPTTAIELGGSAAWAC